MQNRRFRFAVVATPQGSQAWRTPHGTQEQPDRPAGCKAGKRAVRPTTRLGRDEPAP
jgi:hypothetical protein